MELDDLKQNWENSAQQYKKPAYELDDLLTKKVNSPLDALKMKYFRQIVLLPAMAIFLMAMCIKNPVLKENAGIWIVVTVLFLLSLVYCRNYRIVVLMQRPSALPVKQNLEQSLALLQKNSTLHLRMLRTYLALLICTLEITMHYDLVQAYTIWHDVAMPLRIVFYVLLFVVQPFISRYYFKLHFGQYIDHLTAVLDQAA